MTAFLYFSPAMNLLMLTVNPHLSLKIISLLFLTSLRLLWYSSRLSEYTCIAD